MKRKIPNHLWLAVAALAAFCTSALFQAAYGSANTSIVLLTAVLPSALEIFGLLTARRWGYVLTVAHCSVSIVAGLISLRSPIGTLVALTTNLLILAPVLMATKFFFPRSGSKTLQRPAAAG